MVHFGPYEVANTYNEIFIIKIIIFAHRIQRTTRKMKNTQQAHAEKLKESIENVCGYKLRTPRDFEQLAKNIFDNTRQLLSTTTIKRFWGYLKEKEDQKPRISTLNILSQYVGYPDYETFCKLHSTDAECESAFLHNNCLIARSLFKGNRLRVMWNPGRCITIEYIGLNMFKVIESINSKLCQNDIFICERIIENSPLLLSNLIHNNGEPVNYICGKKGGVKYQLI